MSWLASRASKQRWVNKRLMAGLCISCGKPRAKDLKHRCRPCQDKDNKRRREAIVQAKRPTRP